MKDRKGKKRSGSILIGHGTACDVISLIDCIKTVSLSYYHLTVIILLSQLIYVRSKQSRRTLNQKLVKVGEWGAISTAFRGPVIHMCVPATHH